MRHSTETQQSGSTVIVADAPVRVELSRGRFVRTRWTWTLVGFAAALMILVARRPEAIFRAQFFAEDGKVFYLPTFFSGPGLLFEPYAGYLIVFPRLIAYAERLAPPAFAPMVGTIVTFAMIAAHGIRPMTNSVNTANAVW